MTVFPIGDAVCSVPANSTFGAVALKGYVYDVDNMMARLPEPYGDGAEQGTVWRLMLATSKLAFLPLTSDATAEVPDFLSAAIDVPTTCPDGTVADGSNCVACEPGSWCANGDSTDCDAGAWGGGAGLLACALCLPARAAAASLPARLLTRAPLSSPPRRYLQPHPGCQHRQRVPELL